MSGKSSQGHTATINYHQLVCWGLRVGKATMLGLLCPRVGELNVPTLAWAPEEPPKNLTQLGSPLLSTPMATW